MRIFLCFSYAQLRFAQARQVLANRIHQRFRHIGYRRINGCLITGQHDKFRQSWDSFTLKASEVFFHKRFGNFTRTVCTKVHEDNAVAILNFCNIANAGRFHEFIRFSSRIRLFQAFNSCGSRAQRFAFCQQAVSLFYTVPAVITVHGKIAANHRCNTALARILCKQRIQFF